ncbi:MAG TPA: tRNA epoxyqueuosine(34) reductase QueG [Planctomycetota bacterium]|nr:tRNA epoxyqueuosine(34) reductase QueG [Planctomycetota bacterium]
MTTGRREASLAIKREARRIGFEKAGVAPINRPEDAARAHPWGRSMVCVARSYFTPTRDPGAMGARISMYALGRDYHDRLKEDLERLAAFMRDRFGARTRPAVDSSAVLERPYARAAGLGWIGKNTMLIGKDLGSWFFLGEIVTDLALEPDRPYARNYCGSCRRCIDVCPTEAIVGEYELDARRCISYLTIEHRGVIDRELRPLMGNWVFGCDLCQDVCPWNRFAKLSTAEDFKPRNDLTAAELGSFMGMTDEQFRAKFKGSPIKRAKRDGFLRNVAIALGNSGRAEAVGPLTVGLNDASWLVRLHSAWGLGRFRAPVARQALQARRAVESDPRVAEEIDLASRS